MILHPEFIKYVHDNWAEGHGRYPSTGFLTLIFALHICDKVKTPILPVQTVCGTASVALLLFLFIKIEKR